MQNVQVCLPVRRLLVNQNSYGLPVVIRVLKTQGKRALIGKEGFTRTSNVISSMVGKPFHDGLEPEHHRAGIEVMYPFENRGIGTGFEFVIGDQGI